MTEKAHTPEQITNLRNARRKFINGTRQALAIDAALDILDPQPVLADGPYERVDEYGHRTVAYVIDGKWNDHLGEDGTLYYPNPIENPSEFTRIPTLPPLTDELVEKVAYLIFREHDKRGVEFSGTARETSLLAARSVLVHLGCEEQA